MDQPTSGPSIVIKLLLYYVRLFWDRTRPTGGFARDDNAPCNRTINYSGSTASFISGSRSAYKITGNTLKKTQSIHEFGVNSKLTNEKSHYFCEVTSFLIG